MEQVIIDSIEAYERTQRRLSYLLSEEGSASTAVALADSLVAAQGQDLNVKHLCACTYTDAGFRLKDVALVERAVRVWRDLGPHTSASISYNLASAQLYLWQLAVEQKGLDDAWLNKRSHLHEARRLFNLVAQDKNADIELRLKALTDCGNSSRYRWTVSGRSRLLRARAQARLILWDGFGQPRNYTSQRRSAHGGPRIPRAVTSHR